LTLGAFYKKMQENPIDLLDRDGALLPTSEELIKAVGKIRQASIEFRMAKKAAIRFNWPLK
jgi:hypothetical protein